VKVTLLNLVALAVAFAIVPAMAEEPTQGAKRTGEAVNVEIVGPPEPAPRVHEAVETIQRLRLHPAEDSLDVSETARRRPHPEGE
jgi:predicted outer membrane lipoprotein